MSDSESIGMSGDSPTNFEELCEVVQQQQQEIRDLEARCEARGKRINTLQEIMLGDRLSSYPEVDESDDIFTRLTSLAEGLARHDDLLEAVIDIGSESTSEEGKASQIVTFAERKRAANQDKIVVTAPEIKGCTGVSQRYSYDLIDKFGEKYEWASVREAKDIPSSGAGGRNRHKAKGLIVDFDQFNGGGGH